MTTIDCAIAIIFNDKNQILLTQRYDPDHSYSHMKWQFPGGGIEEGEIPSEAALREILEETGLIIELLSEEAIRYDHAFAGTDYVVKLHGFPAKYISGELNTTDPETHDAKWYDYKDIPFNNVLPLTKELTDDAIKYMQALASHK